MKITRNEFDAAIVIILGVDLIKAIEAGNRTRLLSMAIEQIFLDRMYVEDQYHDAVNVIRTTALYLRAYGQFDFAE